MKAAILVQILRDRVVSHLCEIPEMEIPCASDVKKKVTPRT
jgi:hypothetical protein